MMRVSVAWKEPYVSEALNRKSAGLIPAGIHWGFEVAPSGPSGMNLKIWPGDDPDYPKSVANLERDGYAITVTQEGEETITVPAPYSGYLVLEAYYTPHAATSCTLKLVTAPEEHHARLCRLEIPAGTETLEPAMITSGPHRDEGNPLHWSLNYLDSLIATKNQLLRIDARLVAVEAYLRQRLGYTPTIE